MSLLESKKAYFCHPLGDCGISGRRDFEIGVRRAVPAIKSQNPAITQLHLYSSLAQLVRASDC